MMRDWLVVLKDGTRVKVRAECPAERSLKGDEITFGPDGGSVTAVFAPDTVAYYFDTALCAVIVEGPTAVTLSPVLTGMPERLKPPFVSAYGTAVPYEHPQSGMSAQQDAIKTPHDGGRNAT